MEIKKKNAAELSFQLGKKKNVPYLELLNVLSSTHYQNMTIQIYKKISPPKTENFRIKYSIFLFLPKT